MYPLDHIGIATRDLDRAISEHLTNFGFKLHSRETIESQKVEVAFLKLPNTLIELLAPTSLDSTLTKFLETRGEGLHHLCYRVDDIKVELTRLEKLGHRLIDSEPRPGAHKTMIAFIHPKTLGGVLTELCQYPTSK